MMKDLGLSQDAANRTGTATPLGALSLQVLICYKNKGIMVVNKLSTVVVLLTNF